MNMRFRLLALCGIVAAGAAGATASAQTASDSLAIEAAVAQHFKPWLAGKVVMLDSRFGLKQGDVERPLARTTQIAQILGLPVAHFEDVFGCAANCALAGSQTTYAMAIRQPTIRGDTAIVGIETWGKSGTSRAALAYGEEEIVAKVNGVWKFIKTGRANWS
jgi:hypothetical protein